MNNLIMDKQTEAITTGLAVVYQKMRFGVSEGMILSSENKDGLFLIPADNGATAGDCVK